MNVHSQSTMSPNYFNNIIEYITPIIEQRINQDVVVIYLEAGHFNSAYGVDEFSINSLQDAILLGNLLIKKYNKNIKLVYGILIDNLGMSCSEDFCTISPNPVKSEPNDHLPDELEVIIAESKLLKRDKLALFYERAAKNRSIETLKTLLKKNIPEIKHVVKDNNSEIIFQSYDNQNQFLLAKRHDHQFVAKCPALLAQHYKDINLMLHKRFPSNQHAIVIDWSELDDAIKVKQGKQAANVFNNNSVSNATIINIFFGDDKGQIFEINF